MDKEWLKEVLFAGKGANGFKLGTALSGGWFWVRLRGCCVLYRGKSLETIDFGRVLTAANADTEQISPPSWASHKTGTSYYYIVRYFDNCGQQEQTYRAAIKITIDVDGKLAAGRCNNIMAEAVREIAGEVSELMWYYCPLEQQGQPGCFNIYSNGGTGPVIYENPVKISYRGPGFYSYRSHVSAGKYLFAVRTEDKAGKENFCRAEIGIEVTTKRPEAISILNIEAI